VCARARVFELVNVARVYAFSGVARCESTERVVRSVSVGKTACLNTLTGHDGALACLSPSGAHSDLFPGIWRSLRPYWRGRFVCSTPGEV